MMANKQNILLDSIGVLFLVTRRDVSQPRCTTSEYNEHMHGICRMVQREFNIEHLFRIVEKLNARLEVIFESNLVTSRTSTSFKGYQTKLPEFLDSMKAGFVGATAGPAEVDLDTAPVD